MKKWKLVMTAVAITVALTFSAVPAMSQDKQANNIQLIMEKFFAEMRLLVNENIQLTESEAKGFWPIYEDYQKGLDKLWKRTLSLIVDFADNYENMSSVVARKLVDDHMASEKERLELMQSYLPKFRKVLPEKKVARYYQIQNKIHAGISYEFSENIPLIK